MSEVLIYRLRMKRDIIIKDLMAENVLDYLYQEETLDYDTYEEVRDTKPRKKQAELLLEHVEQNAQAIQKMIDVLETSFQRHLAYILKEELPNEEELSKNIRSSFHGKQDSCYPMAHVPCGYAVIINNNKFDQQTKLEERFGSEVDVKRMKKLFEWLQFTVEDYCGKTAAEIQSIIRKYKVEVDHSSYDCFALILMSHGFSGEDGDGIYGKDGNRIYLKNIRDKFTAKNCFSLADKPKLIFVQACRGQQTDEGFVLTDSPRRQTVIAPTPALDDHPVTSATSIEPEDATPENVSSSGNHPTECIPQDADIITAYASTESYAALRNTTSGGWFVTELDSVFRRCARREDLLSMLTTVIGNVSSRRSKNFHVQCPQLTGNLRKKLFFNPVKA